MSKVMSAQGQIVDFEMMKIMGDINAPKNKEVVKKVPKLHELEEQEIPYIESISPEELLKQKLSMVQKTEEVKKVEPTPLIIQEPIVEVLEVNEPVGIVEESSIILDSTNIEEAKDIVDNNRRKR